MRSYCTVWRHGRNHLTPELRAAIATKVLDRQDDLRSAILEEGDGIVGSLKGRRLFTAHAETGHPLKPGHMPQADHPLRTFASTRKK